MKRILNVLSDDYIPLPFCLHSMDISYPQETIHREDGTIHFHQIMVITSGTGILKCRGKSYPLKKGSAFFVESAVPHEYINTGELVSSYAAVYSDAVHTMMKHYGCDGFLYCESIDVDDYIADMAAVVTEYNGKRRDGVISSMLYSLYIKFFEQSKHNNPEPLDKIVLYIEKNYNKKLTLQKLAEVNKSSVSKLCHDFKIKFGCTVFQYIVNFRLNSAKMLLQTDRTASAKSAAMASGFDDVSYFCRAYKRKFGVTPTHDKIKL